MTLRPGLTCRIFQEYSRNYFINQLLLMGRIFNGIFLCVQLFVMFLFDFFKEYSRKILQVRPHLKDALAKGIFSKGFEIWHEILKVIGSKRCP